MPKEAERGRKSVKGLDEKIMANFIIFWLKSIKSLFIKVFIF
jgi:hypothetical protein